MILPRLGGHHIGYITPEQAELRSACYDPHKPVSTEPGQDQPDGTDVSFRRPSSQEPIRRQPFD